MYEGVPDPADGRAKLIRLTRHGHKLIDAAYEVIGEMEAALLGKTGSKDVETTKRTLAAMVELLGERTGPEAPR